VAVGGRSVKKCAREFKGGVDSQPEAVPLSNLFRHLHGHYTRAHGSV
jgi:hypothetical protein